MTSTMTCLYSSHSGLVSDLTWSTIAHLQSQIPGNHGILYDFFYIFRPEALARALAESAFIFHPIKKLSHALLFRFEKRRVHSTARAGRYFPVCPALPVMRDSIPPPANLETRRREGDDPPATHTHHWCEAEPGRIFKPGRLINDNQVSRVPSTRLLCACHAHHARPVRKMDVHH